VDPEFAVSTYYACMLRRDSPGGGEPYTRAVEEWSPESPRLYAELDDAFQTLTRLREIIERVKAPGKDPVARLREELALFTFAPFRLPLCPSFIVSRIRTENIIVFGSSLRPVKLDFLDEAGNAYPVILKVGDDMRQDALALAAIRFIDESLKRFGLKMHLTPYAVLPISRVFGLCQFVVGAKSISKVLSASPGKIEGFFDENTKSKCRSRFIQSSAAYTVISYVLGVGDRHLDNLLMTKKGKFFHVDFGFMFGQDPKPMPCAVRVVPEMVTAFDPEGSKRGSGYFEFLGNCQIVYNAIRRKADEFCCLVAMMAPTELPHLPQDDAEINRVLTDRLHLELSENQAGKLIVSEIERSVAAFVPWLFEILHGWIVNEDKS
jgi:phosphatidylinositol kinase/protein kinase (PI-3  family)